MANGGRDPIFYAQMATANQDAAEVGTFCVDDSWLLVDGFVHPASGSRHPA